MVRATDAAGMGLTNVTIRAESNGKEIARTTTSQQGNYWLTLPTAAAAVDLVATTPDDWIGSRKAIALVPYGKRIDLLLRPSLHVAGKVVALDGKTPHVQLVVELIRPAGAEMELSPRPVQLPSVEVGPSQTGNRVLRLKSHPSYVELPPNTFNHLTEATIEAWVKWDTIKQSWFFGYGDNPNWIGAGANMLPRR